MPKTTYHRDGTVTLWDVYLQSYTRSATPSDRVLASLSASERDRVYRHLVSDEDIRGLLTDAGTAGDLEGAALCRRALDGDRAARRACAEQILDMRAMATEGETDCARCGHDYEADLVRHYDEGGPAHCGHCGLALREPSADWLRTNGYNLPR